MKRSIVVMLAILSLVVPIQAAGVQPVSVRSIRLHNYNNWEFGNTGEPAGVLKSRLALLARHNNVLIAETMEWPNDVDGWSKLTPQSLKALNPNCRIYRYYGLMAKNDGDSDTNDPQDTRRMLIPLSRAVIQANDWWLRDGRGQVVKEKADVWLLDVGKPGFKEAFLGNALARNASNGFHGFVLDYWWPAISHLLRENPRPLAYPTDEDWFYKAWHPFVTYVMDGLRNAGYRVIGNCVGEYGTTDLKQVWQRHKVDGAVYEQGAVGWAGEWLPSRIIERRINAISKDPLEVWVGDGGLLRSHPAYEQKQAVSLAMYYVAIPASQGRHSYHHKRDGTVYWDLLWDFHIGVPAKPAVKRSGKYFWSRKFTQGIVLLNYESGDGVTFSLDRTHRTLEGQRVSGDVRLPAHTAMILAVDNTEPSP